MQFPHKVAIIKVTTTGTKGTPMIFNSLEFIFIFLPLSLFLYHLSGLWEERLQPAIPIQKLFLIAASFLFYGYTAPVLVLFIGSSILFNFLYGLLLIRAGKHRKALLSAGLLVNIGFLGFFKYTDFVLENVNALFGADFNLLHLILPLGISFFTFQQLAWLVDIYRGEQDIPSFSDYTLSVIFFAKLAEGPITTTKQFLADARKDRSHIYEDLNAGLFLLSMGLMKKVFLADYIGRFADAGFVYGNLSCMEGWLTSLSYTMQLYFDFSGYCDMAVGIGRMFGFSLPFNFDSPYQAVSIPDFWKRWHITLTKFLTNYLYIPLGGSRRGTVRTCLNIMIVFLVSGLWHGAGWTFLLWGALHGIANIVCRFWQKGRLHLPRLLAMGMTFFTVNLFWVFFRADSVKSALHVIVSMFRFDTLPDLVSPAFIEAVKTVAPTQNKVALIVLMLGFLTAFLAPSSQKRLKRFQPSPRCLLEILICVTLASFYIASQATASSLYFNF